MVDDTPFLPNGGIDWTSEFVGNVKYGTPDKSMVVLFYNKSVHQPGASQAAGRPVNRDEVFVRIHPPGERLNIVDRPASQQDAHKYPIQYQQFRLKQEQVPDGTPVDMLYPEQPSVGATLRAHGVHTVEALAELSGNGIDSVGMGAQTWVNAAQKYLEVAKRGVSGVEFRKELEERDLQIRRLTENNALLQAQLSSVMANQQNVPTMETIQQLIAGVMQRPVVMPGVNADPQMAMINANHKTEDLRRKVDVKAEKAPQVRQRKRS